MADTPEMQKPEAMAEAAASEARGKRTAKTRAPVEIDLPASAVSEPKKDETLGEPGPDKEPLSPEAGTTSEATTSGDNTESRDTPASPPAQKPALALPALAGLVAGALGGFGAAVFSPVLAPRPASIPPALETRLAGLETKVQDVSKEAGKPASPAAIPKALETRLEQVEGLEARLKSEIAKLSDEIARRKSEVSSQANPAQPASGQSGPAPATSAAVIDQAANQAEIEGLKARLGKMEAAAQSLQTAVISTSEALGALNAKGEATATQVAPVLPQISALKTSLETVQKSVSGLSARDQLGMASARINAVEALAEAFTRGAPFRPAVDLLAKLGVGKDLLAPLEPFAEKGVPGAALLLSELEAIKMPSPSGEKHAASGADMIEKLKASALKLVEVRRTGEITGTDDAAHLARAAQALRAGDIQTASVLIGRLSAPSAPAYSGWKARAEARVGAATAVARLKSEAFAALARAAGN